MRGRKAIATPGDMPETKQPEQADPASALPDQDEIDPKAITRPVLTKQGWVCPVVVPNPMAGR